MRNEVQRWQEDGFAAFKWLAAMYEQAQTLWYDAERYFVEAGWMPSVGGGLGGIAMSQSDLSDWPFIYLKALGALPKEPQEAVTGTLPIFGLCFFDANRVGPVVFAGSVKWSKKPAVDHWALFGALCGHKGRFRRMGKPDDLIQCAAPTPAGVKRFPSVEEIRWFELPLGGIGTADELKAIVGAATEMADGNDADARSLAERHIGS